MRDELLACYERELAYIRQLGAEFAARYPKIAGRLQLEASRCEDPHVERLIEAVAFLAARIHLKIEDEFPEITQTLLGVLFPHYVRPIPSMTIAEFRVAPREVKLTTGQRIPCGASLLTRPHEGSPCRFRTCYDTDLWPVEVRSAQWTTPERLSPPVKSSSAAAALRIELRPHGDLKLSSLALARLRFYLHGEPGPVSSLYELLCNNLQAAFVRDLSGRPARRSLALPEDCLRPVGFDEAEALLPYPRRSFAGYRLIQEYFYFPEKFLFLDLNGLELLRDECFNEGAEIILLISAFERTDWQQLLEMNVRAATFRLNCTPVVNLYSHTAEPILLDQTRFEHPVIADVRRRQTTEVFSIDEVASTDPQTQERVVFEPLYSFRHLTGGASRQGLFWHAQRRAPATYQHDPTEMVLMLADVSGKPVKSDYEILVVRCTVTDADLPARLPFGNEEGDFELQDGSLVKRIVALRKPSPAIRPPLGKGALWRLISHLSLNYLSLVEEGRYAFQELLRVYEFTGSPHLQRQVQGIVALQSSVCFGRVVSDHGISFVRGTHVSMTLDEEQFVGGGAYLFASVLERFLAMYVSMNSFSRLSVRTLQRKEAMREWPARAGQAILL